MVCRLDKYHVLFMQAAEQEKMQRGLVLDMPADEPNRNSATACLHERNLRHGAGPSVAPFADMLMQSNAAGYPVHVPRRLRIKHS